MTEELPPDAPKKVTMEDMMKDFPQMGKMKPSNFKEMARKDARAMRKRMQHIARNPRGKDGDGMYLNTEDMIEVLQCNEALFVILERILKI